MNHSCKNSNEMENTLNHSGMKDTMGPVSDGMYSNEMENIRNHNSMKKIMVPVGDGMNSHEVENTMNHSGMDSNLSLIHI